MWRRDAFVDRAPMPRVYSLREGEPGALIGHTNGPILISQSLNTSTGRGTSFMNHNKFGVCAAAAAAFFFASAQTASAREFADIYTECGLGAMIAPNNAAVAAVTNVTWDLGTTAISSDASSADSCKGGKPKTAAYIFQSYAQLEADLAKGEGKHLTALMTIAGCAADARADVVQSLRTGFAGSVASPDYATQTRFQRSEALFNQVQQASCNAV